MKIKKGDDVLVIAGKNKGEKGKVIRAFPKKDMVLVEGINMQWKHEKPKKNTEKGQRVQRAMPVHVSNVKKTDSVTAEKRAPKKTTKKTATK